MRMVNEDYTFTCASLPQHTPACRSSQELASEVFPQMPMQFASTS